ncbi:MAG: metallophosphoesterase [Bacteroidota bacterium]
MPEPAVYRLAHLSDVHFGRIDSPTIVDALVDEVNNADMDLVVVSGDLTQRARAWQFVAARAFLDRFTAPVLVVPGNHDVTAWWHNPIERVYRPVRKYQHYITDDLAPTFEATRSGLPPLAVLGLNSAHGKTVKGGLVQAQHRARITSYFEGQPTEAFRVLVLHHHLTRVQSLDDHDVSDGGFETLFTAAESGINLVLCGHIHKSTVSSVKLDFTPESVEAEWSQHIVIASAGTATSNRSREPEGKRTNYYNWIRIDETETHVLERRYDHAAGRFNAVRETSHTRDGSTSTQRVF